MGLFAKLVASFAGGELSPMLWGRVDLAKFQVGARTMLNWFVHPTGGASTRPGTQFLGAVDDSTKTHRLIPFRFRSSPAGQNYALVFGHLTMQVVMYNSGTGASGFVLNNDGVTIYTLTTPYASTDLALLKFVQSADTMTICHPSYAARKLTRSAHNSWTLTPITFAPTTSAPTGLAAVASGSTVTIVVTAINDASGEESLPSSSAGANSTSGVFNWTAVSGCSNYNVYKQSGSIFGWVAQVQTNTWTDNNLAPDVGNTPPGSRTPFGAGVFTGAVVTNGGSGYSAPTGKLIDAGKTITTLSFGLSGGVITTVTPAATGQSVSANAMIQITDGAGSGAVLSPIWTDDGSGNGTSYISGVTVVSGGAGYHSGVQVHSYYSGVTDYGGYRFTPTVVAGAITAVAVTVGSGAWDGPSQGLLTISATDSAGSGAIITPTITADGGTNNPQCTTYYMQRQAFGATQASPQSLWLTVTGAFNNMNVSSPTKDTDAITRSLVSREVNEIRHLIPTGQSLLAFTAGAEFRVWPGPNASAVTPAACATLPQTTYGCNQVPPVAIDNDVLFVQERGNRVWALKFDVLQDQYKPTELSILSGHLLTDSTAQYQIKEWAWAAEPFKILWAVRSDGTLLGFTYMPDQQVYAWHRHQTNGTVESICSIPEPDGSGGLFDAVYLIVNRTINGQTKRYVERMAPRTWSSLSKMWFLDCALSASGSNITSVSGLSHLEGQTVYALCDGSVVGPLTVNNGTVTLDGPYSYVLVGLPYTCDLETMNLDVQTGAGTEQGQMKKIAQCMLRLKDTRGLQIGINAMKWDGTQTQTLIEMKEPFRAQLGTALGTFTGDWAMNIPTDWNLDGRVFMRQSYPLPATVLALVPQVADGG